MSLIILMNILAILTCSSQGARYYDPPAVAPGKPLSAIPPHQRQYACSMNQKVYYEHGDIFRINFESRCITYRCELGKSFLFDEGCLDTSTLKCVPVGQSWTVQCHTFTCTKRTHGEFFLYEGIRNQITCYDKLTQTCRRDGEIFPAYDFRGVIREKCTCRILPGRSIIECFQ